MTTLAAEVAAHFAQRAGHFMPTGLRRQWPAPFVARQRVVRRGPQLRQLRHHAGRQLLQMVDAMRIGVAHHQAAIRCDGHTGRTREAFGIIAGHGHHMTGGRHLQHAPGQTLAHIDHAVVRERQRHRSPQHALAVSTAHPRVDLAGRGDGAQRVVLQIGHPHVALRIYRHVGGRVEARLCAEAIDPTRPLATGQRRYAAIGFDHADAVIPGIGHIHAAIGADGHPHRPVELRLRSAAIGKAGMAVAGHRAHLPLRRDLADRVIAGVGHVQVALRVRRDARGRIECRRRPAAIGKAFAATGEHMEHPIGRAIDDAIVVTGIRHEQHAAADRHTPRIAEARAHRRAL
ncbi:hypothetical protein D3C71_1054290 [compost metagenome]